MPTTARYNEEDKLDELFADVRKLFKKVEGVDGKKTDAVLKEIGTKLQEAKTYGCDSQTFWALLISFGPLHKGEVTLRP